MHMSDSIFIFLGVLLFLFAIFLKFYGRRKLRELESSEDRKRLARRYGRILNSLIVILFLAGLLEALMR